MIPLSSCPPWRRLDRSGPARDHDGLAVVTPRAGTRSGEDHRVRGSKIGGERSRSGRVCDGITAIANRKPKISSERGRPPRLLWVAPIDAGQKTAKLRRRDRHDVANRARPQKAASFQTLREPACALAVMPDHLQHIARAAFAQRGGTRGL